MNNANSLQCSEEIFPKILINHCFYLLIQKNYIFFLLNNCWGGRFLLRCIFFTIKILSTINIKLCHKSFPQTEGGIK